MDSNQVLIKQEPKIEEGKKLLKFLDNEKYNVDVCMWFYISESNIWRLIVGSKYFNKLNNLKYYKEFIKKYKDNSMVKTIGIENITLLPENNDLIKLLRTAIRTEPTAIGNIRFTSNVINGILIEDVLIYRIS